MHLVVAALLAAVFYLFLKPKKARYPVEANTACTNDYNAVKLRLAVCETLEMCSKVHQEIEVFYDTYYDAADRDIVDKQYVDLITKLTDIKINLYGYKTGLTTT